jgi:nucleotide-binding universal stress UspA family protein
MRRLMVGTDGSVSGQVAVAWAAAVAQATDADLVVASAWTPSQAELPPETYQRLRAEARRSLDDECSIAREAGIEYEARILDGDPRSVLLDAAERDDVDVLVTGTHGTGSHPHALHLGSVAHHLADHTTRVLATVPASARSVWPARVLVGVDGSEGSAHAVEWCRDLARQLASEVIAAHASQPFGQSDPATQETRVHEQVEEWIAPLHEVGIPTRALVLHKEPVAALTEAGIREQVGLVVVGTGWAASRAYGSVPPRSRSCTKAVSLWCSSPPRHPRPEGTAPRTRRRSGSFGA